MITGEEDISIPLQATVRILRDKTGPGADVLGAHGLIVWKEATCVPEELLWAPSSPAGFQEGASTGPSNSFSRTVSLKELKSLDRG